jgi:GT2 family glycosyltransferase
MTNNCSIASVTVAHNGATVLPRQLGALKSQTCKLDEIIVVDNASRDRTLSLLQTGFSEVTILSQASNVGVGGGFAAGLDYAANQRKHDWIWLLDQDSVPANDCLERLLDAYGGMGDEADGIGILAPSCANGDMQVGYSGSVWHRGFRQPPLTVRDQPISFVDSVISSGTLLRRKVIADAGLPRSDFFMDFVDHEYCLRLRRLGYKIAIVRDSRVEHAIGEPRRVSFFGFKKAWASHVPWREYYMTRNEVFTVWEHDPDWRTKCVTARRLMRHALAVLLFGRKKWACLRMMCRGFADGRAGRVGIRAFEGEQTSSNSAS